MQPSRFVRSAHSDWFSTIILYILGWFPVGPRRGPRPSSRAGLLNWYLSQWRHWVELWELWKNFVESYNMTRRRDEKRDTIWLVSTRLLYPSVTDKRRGKLVYSSQHFYCLTVATFACTYSESFFSQCFNITRIFEAFNCLYFNMNWLKK